MHHLDYCVSFLYSIHVCIRYNIFLSHLQWNKNEKSNKKYGKHVSCRPVTKWKRPLTSMAKSMATNSIVLSFLY